MKRKSKERRRIGKERGGEERKEREGTGKERGRYNGIYSLN